MRLHVNSFYALMLILSYNVLFNITCNGKVQKRAIDFDEISDFADIIEPEPPPIKEYIGIQNSLAQIRNLDLELPKEVTQRFTPQFSNDYGSSSQSQNDVSSPLPSANTESSVTTNYNNDLNKILSFRMKQFKARSKRMLAQRKLQKRYVNLPKVATRGGSYISHLADATNDINLRMQDYAASLMVVLTTPRSTTVFPVGSKITGRLMEIKTIQGPDQRLFTRTTQDVNEKQLQTLTTVRVSKSKASVAVPFSRSTQLMRAISTKKTMQSKSEETNFSTISTHHDKIFEVSSVNQLTPTHSHSDYDYPLLGADGFYSDAVKGNDLPLYRNKRTNTRKRAKREANFNSELYKLQELLNVLPVKISEDRPHDTEVESANKAKQSSPVVQLTNIQHNTSSKNPNDIIKKMQTILPETPDTTISRLSTLYLTTTVNNNNLLQTLSECVTKSSQKLTPIYSLKSSGATPVCNSNPYRWENDIIKELNVKFKKEAVSAMPAAAFITPIVFASKLVPKTEAQHKIVREDLDTTTKPTSATPVAAEPTAPVPLTGGRTAIVPICKGKECTKLNQSFLVYNDTAGDCNKEADEEGGPGGYNIISNDETPTTTPLQKCPINFSKTETSTTTTTKAGACDKQQSGPCEPNDEEDIEPCDMNMSEEAKKKQICKKQRKKPKTPKQKDKRQISYTSPMPYNQAQSNFGQHQPAFVPSSDIQRALNAFASTQFTPNNINVNPTAIPTNQVSAIFNALPTSAMPSTQIERVVKKSVDKNIISSVIENLKTVDQKLADAVDPLHSAQEQLDTATRCDTTTLSCAEFGRNNNDGLLNELSEAEKMALQRLAIKIMANQKLKRSDSMSVLPIDQDSRDVLKRGIFKISPKTQTDKIDYDDADQDRLNRLQRDISVAQEIENVLEKIKKRQSTRQKRNFFALNRPRRMHITGENKGDEYGDFGENNSGTVMYGNDAAKLTRSLGVFNNRMKNNDEIVEEYQTPKKKTKPKKLWRKLFGLTSNRSHNRFLDQDIPNSQSIHENSKKKKKAI